MNVTFLDLLLDLFKPLFLLEFLDRLEDESDESEESEDSLSSDDSVIYLLLRLS